MLSLWLLFMGLVFGPAYLPDRPLLAGWSGGLPMLLIVLIILGTAIPGTLKEVVSHDINQGAELVADLVGTSQAGQTIAEWRLVGAITRHLPDKHTLAHLGLFGALAALTLIICPTKAWPALVGDLLLLAGATELMQIYVDDRSARWADLAIDLSGAATGLLLEAGFWCLWRRRVRWRQEFGSPED